MGLDELSKLFPYPQRNTAVASCKHGWLRAGTMAALRAHLGPGTRVVVELGSWMGKSTRYIAKCAPGASVIAVDHWCGSAEHHLQPVWRAMLPELYETFVVNCWKYRERIIPLRMSTLGGMELIASLGIVPDLVYIDAGHDTKSVLDDISMALSLFPNARLVGDDFDAPCVEAAVKRSLIVYAHNRTAWWSLRRGDFRES